MYKQIKTEEMIWQVKSLVLVTDHVLNKTILGRLVYYSLIVSYFTKTTIGNFSLDTYVLTYYF